MANFPAPIRAAAQSFQNYVNEVGQSAKGIFSRLSTLRNDPDFFQKTCQVAFAALQLVIMKYPGAANLSKFSFVLQTANMHDFYRFLKMPRDWFYPVTADAINENAVLESMVGLLNLEVNAQEDVEEEDSDVEESESSDESEKSSGVALEEMEDLFDLESIAKACLQEQLEEMRKHGYNVAYQSVEEFKSDLQYRLKSASFQQKIRDKLLANPNVDKGEVDNLTRIIANTSLKDLSVPICHLPFLERLNNMTWTVVDLGCILLYARGWGFIDTAKWAEGIGQTQGFQWVKNQNLDSWVVGFVSVGFLLKLLEAIRKLEDEAMTPQSKRQARWDRVTSFAELIYYGSIFTNLIGKTSFNEVKLQWLAIFAKSLGLLSIAVKPDHQYFQRPERATTVY